MFKQRYGWLPTVIILACTGMALLAAPNPAGWEAAARQVLVAQVPDGDPVIVSRIPLGNEGEGAVLVTAMVQTGGFSQRPGKKITLRALFGDDAAQIPGEYNQMFQPFEMDGFYVRSILFVGVDRACVTNLHGDGARAIIWQKGRVLVEVRALHGVEALAMKVHSAIDAARLYQLSQDKEMLSGTVPAGQTDLSTVLKGKYDRFLETQDRGILTELETFARKGNPIAQMLVGAVYASGAGGVEADLERAFEWYLLAAQQGELEAMVRVGQAYLEAEGVAEDPDTGVDWLQKAAQREYPKAQFNLSRWYGRDRDHLPDMEISLGWLRKAAEQGYAEAQRELAGEYSLGWLIPQDHAEAHKWLRRAAEQGDALSQYMLGDQYDFGTGVDQDRAEALKWFRQAAEHGDVYAQFKVGERHQYGIGTAKNLVEAANWYRRAAENGSGIAMEGLAAMYEKGEGVPQDRNEAIRWYRKAVATGEHSADAKKALEQLEAAPAGGQN